jgi:hypothetical protein
MPTPKSKPKRRTGLVIWLVISQLLAAVTLFLWSLAAAIGYSFINTSGEAPSALLIVLWLYPLFPLAMIIGAWIAFRRHKDRQAAIFSGLSFALPALYMLVLEIRSLLGMG